MTEAAPHAFLPPSEGAAASCEAEAHRLYFERREWMAALALWQLRAKLGPPTIESQLALAHCAIVAGTDAALPAVGLDDPAPHSNGRLHDYAELIRTCAWAYVVGGDGARAAKLARLLGAVDRHFKSIYDRQILASADRGIPLPADPSEPLPFERAFGLTDDAARALIARHRRRRVLLFMPQITGPADAPIEVTLCRYLRVSLEQLGLELAIIESARLTGDDLLGLHDRLRTVIAEFRPDVIVCYDLCVSGATAHRHVQDGLLSVLEEARRRLGSKLVISYSDAWYAGATDLIDALVAQADGFHITFPGLLARLSPSAAARTFCYPYPCYDPRPAAATAAPQRPRAAFVGGMSWGNMSRLVWCAEIARAGLPVDLRLSPIAGFQSAADYAALIGSYAISISLVTRSSGDRVYTLRTTEAPFYGSLLLEEASDDTAYFMRPFEHYVPFATLDQLSERLGMLLADNPLRERITRAGSAWVKRHFDGLHFWARLFRQLYEVEASPPAPPARDHRAIEVRYPHSPRSYAELAGAVHPVTRF